MSTVTFYRAVMQAAGTDDRALAKRATAAVFHALGDRLTPEEADQAVAQRPLGLLREERPVCTGHTEACWAGNRRAHFLAKAADRRS